MAQRGDRDPGAAVEFGLEAIALLRTADPAFALAGALEDTSFAALLNGDVDLGRKLSDEGLNLSRSLQYDWLTGVHQADLGVLASGSGDFRLAAQRYVESAKLLFAEGDPWYIASPLAGLASIALAAGEPEAAALLLGRADRFREHSGAAEFPTELARDEHTMGLARNSMQPEAFEAAIASGRAMPLEKAVQLGA